MVDWPADEGGEREMSRRREVKRTLPQPAHTEEEDWNLEEHLKDDEALRKAAHMSGGERRSEESGIRLAWNQAKRGAVAFVRSGSSFAAKMTGDRKREKKERVAK